MSIAAPAAPTAHASLSNSVLKGALSLLSTQPVTWTASLATAVLVPHFLGDANLGRYAVAWTIAQIVAVLGTCGIPSYLTRRVAREPRRVLEISSNALVFAVGLSIVIVIVALAIALPIVGYSDTTAILLALGLLTVLCSTPQNVLSALLMGQERHARYAWLGAGGMLVATAASIGVLALGGGAIGYMAAGTLAAGSVMLLSWRTSGIKVALPTVRRSLMFEIARGGAPFLAWDLTLRVHAEIDRVLLAILSHDAVVGWYAAAGRIIAIPVFIPTLITTPLLPALSRAQNRAELQAALRHALAAVLLLGVPCSAMIVAIAPAIPDLFHWPVEFQHSIPLMMILAMQQPLVAVDMVLGAALIAEHREHRWLRVFMLAAGTNVALNLVFIPLTDRVWANGAIGSSAVSIASEVVMLCGGLLLLPRGLVGRDSLSTAFRVVLAAAALFVVTSALMSTSLLLAMLAGGLTYAVAVILLGAVKISELRYVIGYVRQIMNSRRVSARG